VIVIIDNYDSFTFNLHQLVAHVAGPSCRTVVLRNDAIDLAGLNELEPTHILLSPGPGHPSAARLSLQILDQLASTPVLGVCLGHQALGLAHGARVSRSPRPVHGAAVAVRHDGSSLFRGQPAWFDAALYHSLAVEPGSLPRELLASAWSEHGDIMALRHAHRPHFGVQFHPESFLTPTGRLLVQAFLDTR
jgi:anthranilate synthase component II